jgi:hypothetical protein
MTGTDECFARSATSECGPTRATMHDVIEEMTTDVSYNDSLTYQELIAVIPSV